MAESHAFERRDGSVATRCRRLMPARSRWSPLSTLVGLWIAPRWGTAPVDMIYLPAVLAAAALWGLGPALVAGVAAALAYNFFFTEPLHTFRMDRADRRRDGDRPAARRAGHQPPRRRASASQARLAAAHAGAQRHDRRLCPAAAVVQHANRTSPRSACAELNRLFDCNAMLVDRHARAAHRRRRAGRQPADPERHRRRRLDDRHRRGGRARATSRVQPAEWQFHAGRVGRRGRLPRSALPATTECRRSPTTSCRCSPTCSTRSRSRWSAPGSRTRRASFAGLRERDRVRSALLASIRQDLGPPRGVDQQRRSPAPAKRLGRQGAGVERRVRSRSSSSAIYPICSNSRLKPTSGRSMPER